MILRCANQRSEKGLSKHLIVKASMTLTIKNFGDNRVNFSN